MTDTSGCGSPRKIYDVLIIGAGPVGLATAIGLKKRGINNILVIDQAREFRKVGHVIDLLPNGLRALKYIDSDVYEKIKETASKAFQPLSSKTPPSDTCELKEKSAPPKRLWRQKNLQGEITRSFALDFESWFEQYGEGRLSLSWFDLQTTLRSVLPSELIQADHRCVRVEEEAEWVRIDSISNTAVSANPFAHWEMMRTNADTSTSTQESQESGHQSFYAKLVVAADGINSTIRQILYDNNDCKQWAKPQYSGFVSIGSRIENVSSSMIEELDTKYMQGDQIITVHNNSDDLVPPEMKLLRLMVVRPPGNSVAYLLFAPFDLDSWQNKLSSEILDLGVEALKNAEFPSIFTELVSLSNPERLSNIPFYKHPVNTHNDLQLPWSYGRVVLVGDAAHAMPPFIAQGANQGLEDAAVMATFIPKILDQGHAIEDLFKKYEQIRKPFVDQVQAATMNSIQWTQQEWDDFNEILHRRDYPSPVTLGE